MQAFLDSVNRMGFMLQFTTDNDAFADGKDSDETGAILVKVSNAVAQGHRMGNVLDSNGNKVGSWVLK